MDDIELDTWQDFMAAYDDLKNFLAGQKRDEHTYISRPLFRGQRSADWKLESSLERYLGQPEVQIERYNRYLVGIRPAVEVYTSRTWSVERDVVFDDPFAIAPNYEFMSYARHFGFPAPLLD